MQSLSEDIWVEENSMRLMGTPLRLRMCVVKLATGKLWVHSPTDLSPELKQEIDQLGQVAFIVGASNGHNLWLLQWLEAYPEATLYVSGGIPKKLQLEHFVELEQASGQIWHEDLTNAYMDGVPLFNESVFLHQKSHSLIVTDFVQNHSGPTPPGFAGLVAKLIMQPMGFKGICTAPPLKMGFVVKDKALLQDFINTVLSWNFDRIVVTHGDIIEDNAKQILTDLCQRFLK